MPRARALLLDWGATLARTRDNRTVVSADGHGDEHGCACRKPRPGMFLDLARTWDIDLAASTHVGDSPKDRAAATAAGIATFHWAKDFFGW